MTLDLLSHDSTHMLIMGGVSGHSHFLVIEHMRHCRIQGWNECMATYSVWVLYLVLDVLGNNI